MLLTELFLAAAARHADRPCIDVPPGEGRPRRQVVRYGELLAMASALRERLQPLVDREAAVVVLLPRETPWLYASQLGVLLAGAAHVCLDGSFPDAHIAHVVRDVGAVAVVTDASGAARFDGLGVSVLVVERLPLAPSEKDASRPAWQSERSLAYVIYTSGTTGPPKGVLLEHRGAVNLIEQGVERFALGPRDRVAQGSSPAYDSSIEETWLALASGATVVVMDDATVRLGPDLVAWLRRERVTILCPPPTLLRTMDCASPGEELPELRMCYVGGEPLSEDLAAKWGGALRLENGYGPTECTVTVVRGTVAPGEPVTIGRPVPPHRAHVLDEQLRPVSPGEAGELCIEGPGLARGYLGLPELTAERFPELPGVGRVYRTGDLVVAQADGRLRCLGRIDAQVKVRGYRVELEAIEAVLARCEGVREVVCAAQGEEPGRHLVAFVVPRETATPPDFASLADVLSAELPAYMVPSRFALLDEVPRSVGGKVDRRRLPQLDVSAPGAIAVQASAPVDQHLRAHAAAALGLAVDELADDDDFFDCGGNSLRAAMFVSSLRRVEGLQGVAVRDVYVARTVAKLVELVRGRAGAASADEPARPADRAASVAWFSLLQIVSLLAALSAAAAIAYALGFVLLPWLLSRWSLPSLLFGLPWVAALLAPLVGAALFWLAVAGKHVLIGRYRPGRWSAWSGMRLRHWMVVQLARLVPWAAIEGTELQAVALRAFGARVGRRVHLHRTVDLTGGGWDLLEIGDDASICREVDLGLCELDEGQLVVGRVVIGAGATLEVRAGTGPDVEIGDGALLRPLSFVPSGGRLPDGEAWGGVPAQRDGSAPAPDSPERGARAWSSWRYTAFVLAARALLAPTLAMPAALLAWGIVQWLDVDGAALERWLCEEGPTSNPAWLVAVVLFAVLAVPLRLLELALLSRWLPATRAGVHPRWSPAFWWATVRMRWLERAGEWLSGTLFWPMWLRLAGMKVGRDVEVSTILDVLPEHTELGGGSFLADGVYLGVPRVHRGSVTIAPTRLGGGTFVGNHVVVEGGQQLPDDLLLGISTVADDAQMRAGSSWFGQPAFELPQREVVTVDRRLTHDPGPLRYANRVFWESLRALLPALPALLALTWFDVVARSGADAWWLVVCATLGYAAALAFVVLAAKWLLLGRVRPGQHGLWSCWASRWDFHYVMWQRYARALLAPLEGTLLLPWYLRAMGMRIGRRCVLGDGFAQVVDPDMITIEDGATVHALFQAHSFEDRVLKIDHVRIGAHSTVGKAAVVLYGADVGQRAHVTPHSVVMKRELLLPGRRYAGAPTVEVGGSGATSSAGAAAAVERGRDPALDVARGVAVLLMFWVHFVPEPAADATGAFAALLRWSLRLEALPAAMFLLLVGMAWAASPRDDARYAARRALALVALGVPFWVWVWPNDILAPIGLMLPFVVALRRGGRGALAAALALLVVTTPIVGAWLGHYAWSDVLDDGTHAANHAFGWPTLRWFSFDGAYPLLPWLCLPLVGALLEPLRADSRAMRRCAWLAAPLVGLALLVDDCFGDAWSDSAAALLAITWQPTSLPFVALWGGAAVVVVCALASWSRARGLPRWTAPLAAVGRASLTHYLAHICVVYAAMRVGWPDEDWSVAVGVLAATGYGAFALLASTWWFARRRRGPVEALLGWLSRG